MATGRVRARFFYTRTRPAGQDLWPGPNLLTKQVFFQGPVKGLGPIRGPTKKKNSDPNTNTNTITNINTNTEITNTDFRSTFSLSKSQSKHKFQIYDFHFSLSEIINTNTNSHDWDELNPEKKRKKEKKMETVWDRRRQGRNGVETWEKREWRGWNCLLPFLNLSERRGRLALLVSVLPSIRNGSPASSCLMSSWCSARYTYGLWPCVWDH